MRQCPWAELNYGNIVLGSHAVAPSSVGAHCMMIEWESDKYPVNNPINVSLFQLGAKLQIFGL